MDPTEQHQTEPQGRTSSEVQFARVGLLRGRPLYWATQTIDSRQHANALIKLFNWALGFPRVRLGISARGMSNVLKTIEQGERQEDANSHYSTHKDWLRDLVQRTDISTNGDFIWIDNPDEAKWWVEGSYVNPNAWWLRATVNALKDHSEQIGIAEDATQLIDLFGRYNCTLFGTTNKLDLLGRVKDLLNDVSAEDQVKYQHLSRIYQGIDDNLSFEDNFYWSWRLINFELSHSGIIHLPFLALWSHWPSSTVWAPPPQNVSGPNGLLADDTVNGLLKDFVGFEELFDMARHSCGLEQARPELAGYKIDPPIFYFADPVNPPRPEAYARGKNIVIEALGDQRLLSGSASTKKVTKKAARYVLEEDLVALRGEFIAQRREWTEDDTGFPRYHSCYLLVPAGPEQTLPEESEQKLQRLEYVFSYLAQLEFASGDRAEDIYANFRSISERQTSWTNLLNEVDDLTARAIDLLPSLGQWDQEQVYDDFRKLHVLQMLRVRSKLENERNYFQRAQNELYRAKETTKAHLEEQNLYPLSSSSIGPKNETLYEPFPYRKLGEQLASSSNHMDELSRSIERIETLSTTASTLLESADQRARELLGSRAATLSVLVGFLALIGLAEFIPGAQLEDTTDNPYPRWLHFLPLPVLETVTSVLIITVGLAALGIFVYYVVSWARNRLSASERHFSYNVQALWAYAEHAGTYSLWALWQEGITSFTQDPEERADLLLRAADVPFLVENMPVSTGVVVRQPRKVIESTTEESWDVVEQADKKATEMLHELWQKIERARDDQTDPLLDGQKNFLLKTSRLKRSLESARVADWLRRARYLRYRIDIFTFCPETIPLPRTLCIFWYKSGAMLDTSVFSETNFKKSLKLAGFQEEHIAHLSKWLSEEKNGQRIRHMSVREFAKVLEERGVKANPNEEALQKWEGLLGQ